ncbi:hypothetical protein [Paenibacillus monticola]|uniref:Uncharacterized protein n=1 Tax=Paenibacillus monticola TaxID=2666075 RepID=A0A7X2H9W0_9BACL|nr:hypothetical protein [Paenibacillus monticola]MRN56173.1 hypothetical protein [Paenibacillus monticola]
MINGGEISVTQYAAVNLQDTYDCRAIGVTMHDVNTIGNGGGMVSLAGVGGRNKIVNCNFLNTGKYAAQFIWIHSRQVKPVVTQNQTDGTTSGFIDNGVAGTEGINFIVAGNL